MLPVLVHPPGASTGCPLTFSVDHGRSPLLVSVADVRRIIGFDSPPQDRSGDPPVVTLVSTFQWLKQFRAIATRFDKLADGYQAGRRVASLILWLRELASAMT